MRAIWCALALTGASALAPSTTASAVAAGTLTATPTQLRAGDTVTVSGDVCTTGLTVVAVGMQTMPEWLPKGLPPFVPLDASAINLVQTASGMSFRVTAAAARTSLFFRVDCSDGSSTTTAAGAYVYPPVGEFWWGWNSYGTFVATAGFPFGFGMRSMDCTAGSTATGSLTAPGASAPAITQTAIVGADGVVTFDIDLPAGMVGGAYTGTISCQGNGTTYTNNVVVTIEGNAPDMPPTGSSRLWWPAMALLLSGLLALRLARRPAHQRR